MTIPFIEPDWPAPAGVLALSTTRAGGHSEGPWQSLNLGHHVGDEPAAVTANRRALQQCLPAGTAIQWLHQVHGLQVVPAQATELVPEADASCTREAGLACAVMTADCLPVLFCDRAGSVVAAAHAGWRGLAAGVLEATIAHMAVAPAEILAWLGPAIGPDCFEVGEEVRAAFLGSQGAQADEAFRPAGRRGHFLADLYQLARLRLRAAGVHGVYGGGHCSFSDSGQFFSYRRDGQTGRMASVILLT